MNHLSCFISGLYLVPGLGLSVVLVLAAGCGLDPNAPIEPSQSTANNSGANSSGATATAGEPDNVGSCEMLEDTLAACAPALDGTLQCSFYADYACDVSAYFDCVNDAYGACSNGAFPSVDPMALQDCAPLAACQG